MRPAARDPSRSVPRPPTGEATTIPIIMEKSPYPTTRGGVPRKCSKNVGNWNIRPYMAKFCRAMMATAPAITGLRMSRMSRIGFGERHWRCTKPAPAARPASSIGRRCEPADSADPTRSTRADPRTSNPMRSMDRPAPAIMSERDGLSGRGSIRSRMAAAARKGRLARKIAGSRRGRRSRRRAPARSPPREPSPRRTCRTRSPFARAHSNRNSAMVAGATSAPPTAVTQRAALKRARFGLTSPATDPRANSPMPSHRVREWPTTSLRRPPGP